MNQRILVPRSRRIDIEFGRRHVEVARQHHRHLLFDEFGRVRLQTPEPFELVVEFRAGLRVAVRQVDAAHDDPIDCGFDVARLAIVAVAGQLGPDQHRIGISRQDRDAIPGLLSTPDRAVAGLVDG